MPAVIRSPDRHAERGCQLFGASGVFGGHDIGTTEGITQALRGISDVAHRGGSKDEHVSSVSHAVQRPAAHSGTPPTIGT